MKRQRRGQGTRKSGGSGDAEEGNGEGKTGGGDDGSQICGGMSRKGREEILGGEWIACEF